ncbi:putative MATE family efflux protein [Clostridium tetanomorphum]|uniref:Multidrug export protein MepA n=1 Tax=Clostridium tetanomorphum TaxID=1553 RepID=A0A923J1X4_CLOTT|nr:MATE family efflux transporter [Clostridium tetanomorphum]KAJ50096.1 drug/sodium antiporter, MATE family protein [Clostridium tetanomorphum DSM 665]MBC2399234.1 MATE family efflux transporter [Clostridium tetanomorphum]MBP1862841.1 putative MATE family efflux protein [Clostridium tetanomorphum]NRS86978.1 putative MATE family efflux protein [Clostridium tetanomorphum]NRZ99238.1 putative MATE family efflux protein [Clostridium tetanomorphum]
MNCTTVDNNSMRKKFIRYLLPSVSAMWVYSLYTMVDGIFVSWGVGTTAIASVNIAMPFINFIFAISVFFATGASTLVSIALGKNNLKRANEIFTMNFIAMVVVSIIIATLTLTNLDKIAIFLGANDLTIGYVKEYLQIITIFNGFFITSYCLEVFTKADGFPYLAIVGVVSSALVNIGLDYLFVMKFHWGIKGAAYATGISQVIATLIYIIHFNKKKSKLKFIKCKFEFGVVKKILSIGLPDSLTECSTGVVIYIFNQIILSNVGDKGVVTYSIISYINLLVLMTMIGITQGMQPLCSFYHGREDEEAVNTLFNMSAKTIGLISILIFAIVNIFTPQLVQVFMDKGANEELYAYSIKAIRMFSLSFIIVGYNILISGFFAAIAKPKYATIISISRGLVIITLVLFIMTAAFGENGIWLATVVSEGISVIASIFIFKNNRYNEQELSELTQ